LTIDLGNQIINPIISVYDLQGRMISVPQTFSNNKVQLNTENLRDGFYMLQVMDKNSGKTSLAKFVKQE
ncbi:MAG: T9SS type A sorting domain-containing protein, partial [Chitinophagales bacterium]